MLALCCLGLCQPLQAQDRNPVKFGKISPADFDLSGKSFDSAADAVVIADVGRSEFLGNPKGWFTLEFRHFKRIKILKKAAFAAATIEIPLYSSGHAVEKLEGLKACTYNLENGKVTTTKLEDKSVFTDKISRNWIEKKFTFPDIREGSIVEYSYVQQSDFLFNLQPWSFQGDYPCLRSEYEVSMPDFFQYVTLNQGYLPVAHKSESKRVKFMVTIPGGAERDEQFSFEDNVVDHKWTVQNIPALKEEPYTTALKNYIARIEFQLAAYRFPNSMPKDMMGNWLSVSNALMKDEDFGADLDKGNGWQDELKKITQGATTPLEKARKIFAWVRDNFTCTGFGSIYTSSSIRNVFKNRSGTTADLNLMLVSLLRQEKLAADPVVLSTRAHGFTHPFYPLLSRYNYVIARAVIDSAQYLLDASSPWVGFGKLPDYCYNGEGRLISNEMPLDIPIDADSVAERKMTVVFISNQGKGSITGRVESKPGYFEAASFREKIRKSGEKEFFKSVRSALPAETELVNTSVDSLRLPDEPLQVNYEFKMKIDPNEGLIYFNPMLGDGYKVNPFRAAERVYPVEMPCTTDENYVFNMEIPEGYEVDELPKSAKVSLNEDEGFFEYLTDKDETSVRFRSRIRLKKANFKTEDYATLREFFAFIVKKQSEQIVFKKKK